MKRKVPIRIDYRTGVLEASKNIKLSPYVLRLSTLKKYSRVTIPLNPSKYHLELLRKGCVVDFQLVKNDRAYYVHVCVKSGVQDIPVSSVMGVDLGVRRASATVLLRPGLKLRRTDLSILKDGAKG